MNLKPATFIEAMTALMEGNPIRFRNLMDNHFFIRDSSGQIGLWHVTETKSGGIMKEFIRSGLALMRDEEWFVLEKE